MIRSLSHVGLAALTGILALQSACTPAPQCTWKTGRLDLDRRPEMAPFPLDQRWEGARTVSATWWDGRQEALELSIDLDLRETNFGFERPRTLSGLSPAACPARRWLMPAHIDATFASGAHHTNVEYGETSDFLDISSEQASPAEPESTRYWLFVWGDDWTSRFDEIVDTFELEHPEWAEFELMIDWYPDGRVEGQVLVRDLMSPARDTGPLDTSDLLDTATPHEPLNEVVLLTF